MECQFGRNDAGQKRDGASFCAHNDINFWSPANYCEEEKLFECLGYLRKKFKEFFEKHFERFWRFAQGDATATAHRMM
jgi:hypothetical protein